MDGLGPGQPVASSRGRIFDSVLDLVGNTPLVRVRRWPPNAGRSPTSH